MSAKKTTYKATSTFSGETATRTSARDYQFALDVQAGVFPEYTIPAGRYWITTGHRMHDRNPETGTRGYWSDVPQDMHGGGQKGALGIYSFHGTREAAEKAGRAVVAQIQKSADDLAAHYGVHVTAPTVRFTVVPTFV